MPKGEFSRAATPDRKAFTKKKVEAKRKYLVDLGTGQSADTKRKYEIRQENATFQKKNLKKSSGFLEPKEKK
jgi:prefoldin subunit 5